MENLITVPEALASTAADVADVASAIDAANAAAAHSTTELAPAAGDEVSALLAKLFGGYGQEYRALVERAGAFPSQFTRALSAAGSSYAGAEASNAALITAIPTSQADVALIMGGTWNPDPDAGYLSSVNAGYLRLPSGAPLISQHTPEQFWPVTPEVGNMTFGHSVAKGTELLNTAILDQTGQGKSVAVFGYSQSATVATNEIRNLMAMGSDAPGPNELSFVLAANPNNPNGGLLERFDGFYIPLLDVPFNGATPPNSPWQTSIYTIQYDGVADAPQYPLNIVSDVNAIMGYHYLHSNYPFLTPSQVDSAVQLPTSPGYTGNTQYYMLLTQNLPLVEPVRQIPYVGGPIAELIQPDLRVLVDLGYGDIGTGANYADIPTPASLFSLPNLGKVSTYLAQGAVQGSQASLVELGLLPQSALPDAYPYLPSVNPGLHVYLGQPSVTEVSVIAGALGDVLELIPPIA